MFEPDISRFFVIVDVISDRDRMLSYEILLAVFCLIHVDHKLHIFVFVKGGNIKIKGASGHNHHVATLDLSEGSLDG